ncbi:MAG TPA: metallophosphoesterase [Candidatus Kapabacteria bacterium]|nr:metallophosphoesterase [Candidatus Kapabacteria bacterium]
MNLHRWIPFILIISSFTIIIEAYVLFHWTKYAKKRKFNKLAYKIPIFISILAIFSSLFFNIQRLYSSSPNLSYNFFLIFSSLWYLPKLVIAPFLLIKDLINFLKNILFSIRNKKNIAKHSNISEIDYSKRRTIETVGWTFAAIPFFSAGLGLTRDTTSIQFHIIELELPKFPIKDGAFTIVQISDIHSGSLLSKKLIDKTVRAINDAKPDLVVITGDFVNFRIEELDFILPSLNNLYPTYGTFGCMGNHDYYVGKENISKFNQKLEKVGIKLLNNSNYQINTGKGIVQIAGVENSGMSNQNYADFDKALEGLNPESSIIMLCHEPNNWEKSILRKLPIDLTLSGHTHGGQFGVNIVGKEISPASLVYKYWAGLYKVGDQYLYVNRGLGTTGPPFRVGVKPEITICKLRAPQTIV